MNDHQLAAELAAGAGELLLQVRAELAEASASERKDQGDKRSHDFLMEQLAAARPDDAVLSEEGVDDTVRLSSERVWIVDPLDGTREFVERNGQFAVNIGLVLDGRPALGVVLQPTTGVAWSGGHGLGAFRAEVDGPERAIRARAKPADGIVVLSSKSHGSSAEAAYCDGEHVREHRRIGSAAKFGLLAEGAGDLYPRFGPTSEWDTAAGEALLVAAGGHVERTDGTLLAYGKRGFRNPDFVARGAW